jgi:DNA-binding GntR family transcriptional regulator
MGISRSPVREALSKLEEEGLVEKVPFKGAFVASVSPETIAEIAAIRTILEPYAVLQSLPRLNDGDWKQLQRLLDQLDQASGRDLGSAIEKHLAFHRYFYDRSGNATLLSMWQDWESKLRLFFIVDHEAFQHAHDVAGAHQDLIAVIQSGDHDRIRAAFAHHVHDAPGVEVGDPLRPSDGEKSSGRSA